MFNSKQRSTSGMMIAQPIAMLLVSNNGSQLKNALNPEAYNVNIVDDPGKAMEMLRDHEFDLIVLHDLVFGSDIGLVVRELRRRFPLTPVLVMSENKDSTYQTDLMEAGATDFMGGELQDEELQRRLRLVMQQRRQNRALARRNANLQALTSLARRLHTATEVQTLIAETIKLACQTFKLYGMALVMNEGEMLTIYGGDRETSPESLHMSSIRAQRYDPFRRVIDSGFVQTFVNIQSDSYFTPVPNLPQVESAILVPLSHQDHTFGVLAAFGTTSQPLQQDDLIIYELFAPQFTTALQNARLYEEQERRVKSSSHLLRAWQRFIALNNPEEVALSLREMVQDIPAVSDCIVWLYDEEDDQKIIVDVKQQSVEEAFTDLHKSGQSDVLYEGLDDQLQVTLRLGARPE